MECNSDCVICGYVGAVCEVGWVQGVWDDGVDVSHDQTFKAFHGYKRVLLSDSHLDMLTMAFLGTGTMVVCLKHVGIIYWVRQRWNMSVKTLASWSAHALSARPG